MTERMRETEVTKIMDSRNVFGFNSEARVELLFTS